MASPVAKIPAKAEQRLEASAVSGEVAPPSSNYRSATLAHAVNFKNSLSVLNPVEIRGVGIHTGKLFEVKVTPFAAGQVQHEEAPIEFFTRFEDVEYSTPALWTRLSGTARSTALVLRGESRRKLELRTVEHFLAAAFVLGLRARVEISSVGHSSEVLEMPILDGAAEQWIRLLKPLALAQKNLSEQKVWVPLRSLEIGDGPKRVLISPHSEARDAALSVYSCSVDFAPSWKQESQLKIDWQSPAAGQLLFESHFAPARTFGFVRELQALAARGLAMGGSLDNALVLDEDKVVNPEGFKVPNELAAHKLLDAIGDFALLGAPVLGRIECFQAGHSMHIRAMEEAQRMGTLVEGTLTAQGLILRS